MWWKKTLASILTVFIVLVSILPITASASQRKQGAKPKDQLVPFDNTSWEQKVSNGLVNSEGDLLPGGVRLTQTATEQKENKYQVTLAVESREDSIALEGKNYVLLLDTSAQSQESGALATNKELLSQIITQLLSPDSPHKVALVACHQQTEILSDFVGREARDTLLSLVAVATGEEGLYLEQGIRESKALFQQEEKENHLFLFTAGNASYSTEVNLVELTPICQEDCTNVSGAPPTSWDYDVEYRTAMNRVGRGNSYTSGLIGRTKTPYLTSCQYGNKYHQWRRNQFPENHGDTAVFEAQQAQKKGISITGFAAGSESTSNGGNLLESLCTNGVYYQEQYPAFSLKEEGAAPSLQDGKISLQLNKFFTLSSGSATVGTVSQTEHSLFWELEDNTAGELSFMVTVNSHLPGFIKGEEYSLYKEGEFSYQNSKQEPVALLLPELLFRGNFATIYKVGVASSQQGEYLTATGEITQDPSKAVAVTKKVPVLTALGVNQWGMGEFATVTAGDMPVTEYGQDYTQAPYSLEKNIEVLDCTEYIVYFPYVKEPLTYTVEYYYAGQSSFFDSQQFSASYGTKLTMVPDSSKLPPGYQRSRVDGLPATLLRDGTVIQVEYSKDSLQTLPFTFQYYRDHQDKEEEEGSVWAGAPNVSFSPDPGRYAGYQLDKVTFGDLTAEKEIQGMVTQEENVFTAFYSKDRSQIFPYVLDYYVDGKLVKSSSRTVWVGKPEVRFSLQPKEIKETFSHVVFDGEIIEQDSDSAEVVISRENNRISLYYDSLQEPEPEPETLHFTIYTFYNGKERKELRVEDCVYKDYPYTYLPPEVTHPAGVTLEKIVVEDQVFTEPTTYTLTQNETEIYVYYTFDSSQRVSFTLAYYFDGVYDPKASGTVHRQLEDSYLTENTLPSPREGFVLAEASPALPFFAENGATYSLYYKPDGTREYEYKIRYYKEGKAVSSATEYGRVSMLNPEVTITPTKDKFADYVYSHVSFGSVLGKDSVTGRVTVTDNVFEVHYILDLDAIYQYEVQYYYGDILDQEKTEHFTVHKTNPVVEWIPFKPKEGYDRLPTITPGIPVTITDNGMIITVQYGDNTDGMLPKPEEPGNNSASFDSLLYFEGPEEHPNQQELLTFPVGHQIVPGEYIGNRRVDSTLYTIQKIIITETFPFQDYRDTEELPIPPPTLGDSGEDAVLGESSEGSPTLGESGMHSSPGSRRATPPAREAVGQQKTGQKREQLHFLNRHDYFTFRAETEYEIEVFFRPSVPIPPGKEKDPEGSDTTGSGSSSNREEGKDSTAVQDKAPIPINNLTGKQTGKTDILVAGYENLGQPLPSPALPQTGGSLCLETPMALAILLISALLLLLAVRYYLS